MPSWIASRARRWLRRTGAFWLDGDYRLDVACPGLRMSLCTRQVNVRAVSAWAVDSTSRTGTLALVPDGRDRGDAMLRLDQPVRRHIHVGAV